MAQSQTVTKAADVLKNHLAFQNKINAGAFISQQIHQRNHQRQNKDKVIDGKAVKKALGLFLTQKAHSLKNMTKNKLNTATKNVINNPTVQKGAQQFNNYKDHAKAKFKQLFSQMPDKKSVQKTASRFKQTIQSGQIKNTAKAFIKQTTTQIDSFRQDPTKYFTHAATIMGVGLVKFGNKVQKFAQKQAKQHQMDSIETGHKNIQGLFLVKDPKVANGYRFKASKQTSFTYGKDADGKPLRMTLKPGEPTGLIIANTKQDRKILARYSHGNRYIKTAIAPGSVLTLNYSTNNNVLDQNALINKNSTAVLSGQGALKDDTIVSNSQVQTDQPVSQAAIINSNLSAYGKPVKAIVMQNSTVDAKDAALNSNVIINSEVKQQDQDISKSRLINTSVDNHDKQSHLSNVVVNNANLHNTTMDTANINNGNYDNVSVNSSILRLNANANISNSDVKMSQVQMPDTKNTHFNVDNTSLNSTTATVKAGQTQNFVNASLERAITLGNVDLNNSNFISHNKHTNVIKDFNAKNFRVNTKLHNFAFRNKTISGKFVGKPNTYKDINIPESAAIKGSKAFDQFLTDNAGLTGHEAHSNEQTPLSDQIAQIIAQNVPPQRKQKLNASYFFKSKAIDKNAEQTSPNAQPASTAKTKQNRDMGMDL